MSERRGEQVRSPSRRVVVPEFHEGKRVSNDSDNYPQLARWFREHLTVRYGPVTYRSGRYTQGKQYFFVGGASLADQITDGAMTTLIFAYLTSEVLRWYVGKPVPFPATPDNVARIRWALQMLLLSEENATMEQRGGRMIGSALKELGPNAQPNC